MNPDEVVDCNFVSVVDFVIARRLNSYCSKEKIEGATFEKIEDEYRDLETTDIAWLDKKQPFKINEQIQQREPFQANKNLRLIG